MRICLLGPFPPFRGGIAQFNTRLAAALEEEGHSVERAGFRTLYPGVLFPGRTQLEPPGSGQHPAVIRALRPTAPLSWPGTRRMLSSLGCRACIVQWWHPFFAPCLMSCMPRGIPSAAVCHNLSPHEGFPLAGTLTARFLGRVNTMVVHSGEDQARAEALGGKALRLFHPVYDQYLAGAPSRDEARKSLGIHEDMVVLLFFGLVREYKGLDVLIEAMDLLPQDHVLLAAGENYGSEPTLVARASSLGDRFIRHDLFVPDSGVARYFMAADMVVLPYRSATQSGVAQIALAFRKPVVVTDVGGLAETVEPGVTGEISPAADREDLARAVLRCGGLLDDPRLEERIEAFSRRFSWRSYAERVVKALT